MKLSAQRCAKKPFADMPSRKRDPEIPFSCEIGTSNALKIILGDEKYGDIDPRKKSHDIMDRNSCALKEFLPETG